LADGNRCRLVQALRHSDANFLRGAALESDVVDLPAGCVGLGAGGCQRPSDPLLRFDQLFASSR
jgi:hypothetical protein